MINTTDQILLEYLQLQQPLSLSELGTLQLKRNPAQLLVAEREIRGPQYFFEFTTEPSSNTKVLDWLVLKEAISVDDAEKKLAEFISQIKKQLNGIAKFEWNGVGTFVRTDDKISFESFDFSLGRATSVSAQKIIRETAEHIVLVGETEKTSTEMSALLSVKEKNRSWSVLTAYIILLFCVSYLGWNYYKHSYSIAGFSNQSSVSSTESNSSYHILP